MRQDEIWISDLNPVIVFEQAGKRPVVLLSSNLTNDYQQVVITAPYTPKIKNYKGNLIQESSAENGLKQKSELMIFHICSLTKQRLIERLGKISQEQRDLALETLKDLTPL